jgi:hypothetical protein
MNTPFAPGDKVVRVSSKVNPLARHYVHPNGITRKDQVYCVTEVFYKPALNSWQMALVGFPTFVCPRGFKTGIACANFRKVEEVGLPMSARQLQEAK